jgi:hypothetical protein
MMIEAWGPIPATALKKAEGAYGRSIYDSFDRGLALLRDTTYRDECLKAMAMEPSLGSTIIATLEQQQSRQSSPKMSTLGTAISCPG